MLLLMFGAGYPSCTFHEFNWAQLSISVWTTAIIFLFYYFILYVTGYQMSVRLYFILFEEFPLLTRGAQSWDIFHLIANCEFSSLRINKLS